MIIHFSKTSNHCWAFVRAQSFLIIFIWLLIICLFGIWHHQMGFVGQVKLHEDPVDFSKYELHINVKFHEDQKLRRLASVSQSGGEQSVSTIIFLLSLQQLDTVPFRLVDEINQVGVDLVIRICFLFSESTFSRRRKAENQKRKEKGEREDWDDELICVSFTGNGRCKWAQGMGSRPRGHVASSQWISKWFILTQCDCRSSKRESPFLFLAFSPNADNNYLFKWSFFWDIF
jgi:hypothetical protein